MIPDITITSHGATTDGYRLSVGDFGMINSSDVEARYGDGSFVYIIENGIQISQKLSDGCEVSDEDITSGIKDYHGIS